MNHARLDELCKGNRDLSDLEKAARVCDEKAKDSNNILISLHYQNAAIAIRSIKGWTPYVG